MAKYSKWQRSENSVKVLPVYSMFKLDHNDMLSAISFYLNNHGIPENKTEIMEMCYKYINNRDFSIFKTKHHDWADKFFDKFFKDFYEV